MAGSPEVAAHGEFKKFADDAAMQVATMTPLYVARSEAPAAAVAKQKEIFMAQLREENKPEAAWPKITEGKVTKWFSEVCLLEQESVITPGSTVEQVQAAVAKQSGGQVQVKRFVRFERGEGIEKKADDFAAEVAKMAGQ